MRPPTLPLLVLCIAGCAGGPDLPPSPTEGDAIAERSLDGAALREELAVEGGFLVSPTLEAPDGATRAGFLVTLAEGAAPPRFEARGIDRFGFAGPWVPAETTWQEDGQLVARADLGLTAHAAQMRLPIEDAPGIAHLLWSAVVPMPRLEGLDPEPEVAGRTEALRGELSDLVRSRADWGARSPVCSTADPDKHRMAIHHTVTPAAGDPAERLRGIQRFHIDTRGWCDIGYHFLVSLDGTLWEGRELGSLGTHVADNNSGNIGISFIGCFQVSGCNDWTPFDPPAEMMGAAATLVARLSDLYGIEVNASTVKGHRDHAGAETSCPGDNLHGRLDEIRAGGVVAPPAFAAEYVEQTFPFAADPYPLAAGSEESGHIDLRNVGTETWRAGVTMLGTTEPRDGPSAIAGSDWVSPNRAATVEADVPPGEVGRFRFSVRAPDEPGDYPQYFNLVHEGVAWFSDPGQGGPRDDLLQVRVESMPGPELVANLRPVASPAGRVVGPTRTGEVGGGCAAAGGGGGAAPLLLLLLVAFRRRR